MARPAVATLDLEQTFRVLGLTVHLRTNAVGLIESAMRFFAEPGEGAQIAAWSFLAALPAPELRNGSDAADIVVDCIESAGPPRIRWSSRHVMVSGPLRKLEAEASDQRYTIFGNAGVLSRIVYFGLERHRQVLSLHATVLATPDERAVVIAAGPAGSGKSDVLLDGLYQKGMRLVSTEMAHLQVNGAATAVLRGSMHDNIRPSALERHGVKDVSLGGRDKTAVSFERFGVSASCLDNPRLLFLFPRIEGCRNETQLDLIESPRRVAQRIFESASEMLVRPRVYWEQFPAPPADLPDSAERRWSMVQAILRGAQFGGAWALFGGPTGSLDGVLAQVARLDEARPGVDHH